jgi:hypothetical protein
LPPRVTLESLARFRQNHRDQAKRYAATHRAQRQEYNRKRRFESRSKPHPRGWLSIDGEGWGEDELGRQNYRFMVAATENGFEDVLRPRPNEERLRTIDTLEWLCWLQHHYGTWAKENHERNLKPHISGFGMGYDYAHIVLDLELRQLKDLFHNQDSETPWVEIVGDAATYRLKLTAGRLQIRRYVKGLNMGYANIWDTFRYFQAAFAKASKQVATEEEKEIIAAGKERRGIEEHDWDQEIRYALTECRVHSRLMRTLEHEFRALELFPNSWYGPGSVAHMALKQQKVDEFYVADEELDLALVEAARRAFIGGRFETNGHGRLPFLMAYDITSAYPHGATKLPCLVHTDWKHLDREAVNHGDGSSLPFWTLYRVKWDHHGKPLKGGWGPWPSRVQPADNTREGQDPAPYDHKMLPVWPWTGENWVWGPEYRAGRKLLEQSPHVTVEVLEAWVPTAKGRCHHEHSSRPFAWVETWFYERLKLLALGDTREKWIKLILNSLYGKLAQLVGKAQWHSWLWAGMITAHCRSQLLQAIALDPEAVVMTATDAVYSRRGLDLETNAGLGGWTTQALGKVFIVQSGFFNSESVYGETKARTRGIPPRFVDWDLFESTWDDVMSGKTEWDLARVVIDQEVEHDESGQRIPGKPFQIHIGIGLAQLWNKPEMLGRWHDYPTEITFATDKRPLPWPDAPKSMRSKEWRLTQPWFLTANAGVEYSKDGKGIGEDKFIVMDQPNATEWGEI